MLMLVVAMTIASYISRSISKPLSQMNEAAQLLAKGNYEVSFHAEGFSEVAELSSSLNYAASELSKVESLRKELIANVSHDLRTPLTMITGYAEIIRDIPDENTPENVQIIIDEANRLSLLVNDLLDLSKIQAGAQSLTLSRFSLTEMIDQILTRYNALVESQGYTIKFTNKVQDAVMVSADETKLNQVVYNLVNNALNYSGIDKAVEITLSLTAEGKVRIEVIDNGPGIAEEMIPYIWERYYKVDKGGHLRAEIGTGLGLSIVKTILEMHSASFGVNSTLGEGSTFWFELSTI
jgi:signal transduction histidine kinase